MNFSLPPQTERRGLRMALPDHGLPAKRICLQRVISACLLSVVILFAGTDVLADPVSLQQITVTGKVTSVEDQVALPGVSVFVKGSQAGTVTDTEGRYTISVPSATSVLVISFIGYKTVEVGVEGRNTVDVSLESDITQLGEVVVTAFGMAQDKKALISATQEVAGKDLALSRETNLVDALNAKVAGVQITRQGGSAGAASGIVIRGLSSISGENQPLFVVDGVPISNAYRTTSRGSSVDAPNRAIDINPNDIETINVLKGPAATALYGIQAGSGVVIITTKKGKRSDGRNVSVNFSSNFSLDKIMRNFPANMRYAQGDGSVYNTTTFAHFGPPITTLRYDGSNLNPADPRGRIVDMNDPSADPNARVIPVNNQDKFYEIGKTYDNNLSLSGGNKNSTFYISIGNYSQDGIIPNNEYDRTSVKMTAETSLHDKFKIGGSATYVYSTSTRFGRGDNLSDVIQGTVRTPPTFDNAAGYIYPLTGAQRQFRAQPDNPFWTINLNPYRDEVNRIIGYVQATYDPTSWLNIMYRLGADVASDKRNQQWAKGSTGGDGTPGGRVLQDVYNDRLINSDLIATATKTFGDFNVSLLLGHNYFTRSNGRQFIDGRNLLVPGLYNIGNTQESLVQIQNLETKKTAAAFSRLSVDYKNMLFLELSGRNEWTSTLRSPNNSFFYGSSGLGFVFSEAFNMEDGVLTFGKLRGAYAEAGRDAVPYSDQTFYSSRAVVTGTWSTLSLRFPLAGSGISAVDLSNISGNAELRPERTKTIEFGTELKFLNNRIGLDVTYYRKLDVDQIILITAPGSTGFTNKRINAGEIENKGWEILANATPVDGKFTWEITANFTRNRNTVLDLPVDRIALSGFGNLRPLVKEGEPFSVFYGTAFLRDAAGNMIIDANGYPQRSPITAENPSGDLRIGDPNPDWLMGVRNTFSYSNFNLTFLWDFRRGGDVANITSNWQRQTGVPDFTYDRGHMVVFNGVTEDGSVNTKPVLINEAYYLSIGNRDIAERFVEDGSWIRLRDVTLSYGIPSSFASKLKMKRLNLSLYGRNLLLFTGYSGVDPETNFTGPATAAGSTTPGATGTPVGASIGVDAFGTPTSRSYGVSLNATF